MKRLWYYTSVNEIEKSIRYGKINLPKVGNPPSIGLSANPVFDIPPDIVNIEDMFHEIPIKLIKWARVEILTGDGLIDWATYKNLAGIPEDSSRTIEQWAIEDGANPKDWFYIAKNIPQNQWRNIEYLKGGKWTEFTI